MVQVDEGIGRSTWSVLGIEPTSSPPEYRFHKSHCELRDLRVDLNVAPADLVRSVFVRLRLHPEDTLEQPPVRPDSEVALAQHDEACYVLHRVRRQVVQLDVVRAEDGEEERVKGKLQTSVDVVHKGDVLVVRRRRSRL